VLFRSVNARDRRSFVLELTPAGEAAAARVQAAVAALEARVRERVGERALAGFERVLREL